MPECLYIVRYRGGFYEATNNTRAIFMPKKNGGREMALYCERVKKVIGSKETTVYMEHLVTKLRTYGWMQSYLLPHLSTINTSEDVIIGMTLLYDDLVDELEAIVDSPIEEIEEVDKKTKKKKS